MRKCFLLMAALLLSAVSLSAQLTPYEYGHRWYFAFQGGPVYFNSDYSNTLPNSRLLELFSIDAAVALGYNLTDAHELRFSGSYGLRTGVCEDFYRDDYYDDGEDVPIYTYRFHSTRLSADYVLNMNALAEYNIAFSTKLYAGLGAALTYDFTEPEHPEVWVSDPNLTAAIRVGYILEYDFKDGFGLYFDNGLAFFPDRYNGREVIGFPADMEIHAHLGLIYHFPLNKKHRR